MSQLSAKQQLYGIFFLTDQGPKVITVVYFLCTVWGHFLGLGQYIEVSIKSIFRPADTCIDMFSKISIRNKQFPKFYSKYYFSNVCMFVCLLAYSCLSNFSAIWRLSITITGDRAANLGLCSALTAFEQGGPFIVPHLL